MKVFVVDVEWHWIYLPWFLFHCSHYSNESTTTLDKIRNIIEGISVINVHWWQEIFFKFNNTEILNSSIDHISGTNCFDYPYVLMNCMYNCIIFLSKERYVMPCNCNFTYVVTYINKRKKISAGSGSISRIIERFTVNIPI